MALPRPPEERIILDEIERKDLTTLRRWFADIQKEFAKLEARIAALEGP